MGGGEGCSSLHCCDGLRSFFQVLLEEEEEEEWEEGEEEPLHLLSPVSPHVMSSGLAGAGANSISPSSLPFKQRAHSPKTQAYIHPVLPPCP